MNNITLKEEIENNLNLIKDRYILTQLANKSFSYQNMKILIKREIKELKKQINIHREYIYALCHYNKNGSLAYKLAFYHTLKLSIDNEYNIDNKIRYYTDFNDTLEKTITQYEYLETILEDYYNELNNLRPLL